mmetsp:Transcript_59551/g.69596  ORF Transcript_59551/g.69596 Transcript_59551/m.69596 type:complete len:82 (-) Transcript_59551:806-1051(-)
MLYMGTNISVANWEKDKECKVIRVSGVIWQAVDIVCCWISGTSVRHFFGFHEGSQCRLSFQGCDYDAEKLPIRNQRRITVQ